MRIRKHTGGTWSVSNGHLLRVVASFPTLPGERRQTLVIAGVHKLGKLGGYVDGDPLANARLIAAAPDMLRALQLVARAGMSQEAEFFINKVIAKAQPIEDIPCQHDWDYTNYGQSCKLCGKYEDV